MQGEGEGWRVVSAPSPALPQVFDATGTLVASLHCARSQAAGDAVLLAHGHDTAI